MTAQPTAEQRAQAQEKTHADVIKSFLAKRHERLQTAPTDGTLFGDAVKYIESLQSANATLTARVAELEQDAAKSFAVNLGLAESWASEQLRAAELEQERTELTNRMEDETGQMPVDRAATVDEIIDQVRLLKDQLAASTEFYSEATAQLSAAGLERETLRPLVERLANDAQEMQTTLHALSPQSGEGLREISITIAKVRSALASVAPPTEGGAGEDA